MSRRNSAETTARQRAARRARFVGAALVLALVAVALWSAVAGQFSTSPTDVLGALLRAMSIDVLPHPSQPHTDATLWYVRFPRVALAAAVGAGLGIAGVLLQGVFANPLAEPGIIGVSSGAAVGAATAIALSGSGLAVGVLSSPWGVALAAFLGGLVTTALIYAASREDGQSDVVTLILVGVAINAVCGGLLALLTFLADTAARDRIVFWQMGSLAGADWPAVGVVALVTLPSLVLAYRLAGSLDLLALGETQAGHLGVDVERLRTAAIVLVALVVAVGVAFTGIIAFIGLVVPHALRLVLGPGHRVLLPMAALGGAMTLLFADVTARTLVTGADLPLGMLTSLVGGPVFFLLLRRTRRTAGGWSA